MSDRSIWKYPLVPNDASGLVLVSMPARAKILCCQLQGGTPTVWAMVNPHGFVVTHGFALVPTGARTTDELEFGAYLATLQVPNGIVAHVFDLGER